MIVAVAVLWVLAGVSWTYWIIVWWRVKRFFGQRRPDAAGYAPPVSVLKPVRGMDAEAYRNFASFCRQDYPQYELLFGVASLDDPAVPMLRRLQAKFADLPIRLIVAPKVGENPKSCIVPGGETLSCGFRCETCSARSSGAGPPSRGG